MTPSRQHTLTTETVADGVVQVTLDRPDRGNGVVPEMAQDLVETFSRLDADSAVRAVVLTGAGKQFSAGADLKTMREHLEHKMPKTGEPYNARVIFPVIEQMVSSRLPLIAAINGGATAGGMDLALACDIRLASTAAKFGHTYINLGLPPGNGGTWFLPRLVGSGVAAELVLTGDVVDAAHAAQLGLVNRVVEPERLLPDAIALAERIAAKSWRAVQASKQSLRASWQVDLAATLSTNYWAHAALQPGPDVAEGLDAFLQKRPARFNQR
ncbi:enoyl-CoA hydratase/isomerase family protein [Pseudonocardia sp. KRD291]|uniref:enoyl-CoA hydratase/isomerase family protein n=1 Tax=Pseudonocardia sp. KRD291 TaxID=2792007 RepID=UPI001C5C5F2C|nr:enoyl-CoA hydratase/isomerase family protein [Pseudonocardia sp. KRD291]MBW0101016.1 enoyl-CoA hydratase/isomerase family protein [Pseudonocardia sp. KRD291]